MKQNVKFYKCEKCGNVIGLVKDTGVPVHCCGQPMKELEANVTDASKEKHVPAVTRKDGKIEIAVGEAPHPMTDEHFIEWVAVVTKKTTQRISLSPGDKPFAVACDAGDGEVYAYCNLHGLWKTNI